MAPVRRIEEFPRRGDLYLGARIGFPEIIGQSGHGLERGQSAAGRVKPVGGYAAPLLIGKVQNVQAGMKAEVAGT